MPLVTGCHQGVMNICQKTIDGVHPSIRKNENLLDHASESDIDGFWCVESGTCIKFVMGEMREIKAWNNRRPGD